MGNNKITFTTAAKSPAAILSFSRAFTEASFKWGDIAVTLEPVKNSRSNRQNRYYWGVVVCAVRNLFNQHGDMASEEFVHRYLKAEIGGMKRKITLPNGATAYDIDTSTRLTTAQWEDWMQAIRAWAAEYGCFIPLPNEIMGEYDYA